MPFIWNDETYWDRWKSSNKIFFKVTIPAVVGCFMIISIFMYDTLSWLEIFIISVPIVFLIETFVDIFLQLPHPKIPDTYPKWAQTVIYIVFFLVACFLFYMVELGVLQHYYPTLKNYICCDIVKNFPRLN